MKHEYTKKQAEAYKTIRDTIDEMCKLEVRKRYILKDIKKHGDADGILTECYRDLEAKRQSYGNFIGDLYEMLDRNDMRYDESLPIL